VRQTVKDLVKPITLGSTTTVLAFLSLRFANASMLSDIGLFAGFSLIGAVLCSLLFLPHLVDDNFFGSQAAHRGWKIKVIFLQTRYARYIVFAIFIFTPVMWYFANDVKFNSDMNKLNFMSPQLRETDGKLNRITKYATQSVYMVADGRNLEEALQHNERIVPEMEKLKRNGTIRKYSSVSSFLISDSLQENRIQKWNKYWTK